MSTPKSLTDDEVTKFLDSFTSYRDRCMMLFMLDAGLRVGELVRLRQNDLYYHGCVVSQLVVRAEISKTRCERMIPMSPRLTLAVQVLKSQVWMKDVALLNHYAFYTNNYDKHITARQVERIVGYAGKIVLHRRVTPHMLRHTFGSKVLRKSNIRVAQELLGHKRITSTQIYTHPDENDKRNAIDGISKGDNNGRN